jgi:hypothetical protein
MNRASCSRTLVPIAFAFAVAGCNAVTPLAPPPANENHGSPGPIAVIGRPGATTAPAPELHGIGGAHIMPVHRPDRAKPAALPNAPAGAHLTYYGGPVLAKVKVFTVFWSSSVNFQSQLNAFYGAVSNSAYFDWLTEYNTPTQTIARGSFLGSLVDPSPPTQTALTNADLQTELGKLIDAGKVPAPTADTLYMMHFPPGVTIDLDGSGSCVVFCAYHNTFVHNGVNVYYGVMPDQGGSCAGGCGGDASTFNNLTSVSSHELIESVTDAAVGLATVVGPPLAWYDSTNGEIGDICNAQQGSIAGYVVQTQWSNKANACIVTGGSCTPQCTGKQCGSDGCSGSCGNCPTGQSCDANGQCQASCVPACTGKQCGPDGCGGNCGSCPTGQSCDANGKCQGTAMCAHGECDTGAALTNGCDACVTKICAADSYCCTTSWDSICVGEVGSICGQSCTLKCAHDECKTGTNLTSGCDACVTQICAADAYCCSTSWDRLCVNEVGSICGKSCGATCAHAICTVGTKLATGCDPCVTQICTVDSYCCANSWDSICVGEVASVCGKSCS